METRNVSDPQEIFNKTAVGNGKYFSEPGYRSENGDFGDRYGGTEWKKNGVVARQIRRISWSPGGDTYSSYLTVEFDGQKWERFMGSNTQLFSAGDERFMGSENKKESEWEKVK